MKVRVTEQGVVIPKSLLDGVDEVEIYKTGDRVIVRPVISAEAMSKDEGDKKDKVLFADKYAGFITLREDDPDPRYQYLIQKYLRIEKENP